MSECVSENVTTREASASKNSLFFARKSSTKIAQNTGNGLICILRQTYFFRGASLSSSYVFTDSLTKVQFYELHYISENFVINYQPSVTEERLSLCQQ